jgi:two-component system sensor histidine kinase DegS
MASYLLNTAPRVVRNPRFWLVVGLFAVGIILHYPQQLPFMGLEAPSSLLGLTRHTIERVYLLVPVIYAGFAFGLKGGIAGLVAAFSIMLPRVILISPSPTEASIETAGVMSIGIVVNLLFQMHRREQQRARAAGALLKAEEEKWRSSFNALEDVMLIIDRDYSIEDISESGLVLLGKSREEVIGKKCYEIITGTDCPRGECPCQRTLQTRQVESLVRYEERFGRYFFIKSSPIFDDNGEIVKFVDLRRDITELKRAEEMLYKIVDGSSISSFVIGSNHKVTLWNTAIEALTGIKREEIVGTSEQWRAFFSEKRPVLADLIVDGASAEEIEVYYHGKCHKSSLIDGAYEAEGYYPALGKGGKWLHFTASPIKDSSGEIIGAIETLQDITEGKEAEHKLKERVKELQCLFSIANIAQRPGITLDELYQEVANLLPAAWQYPEISCARIAIDDNEFKTANYRDTEWKQSSDIKVHRKRAGVVEVNYLEEKPDADDGPFLKEERLLIDAVAERLGIITEHKETERALEESERSYRELFEVAPDAIWVHDLQGNILKANKATEKLTGFSAQELAGVNVKALLSEEGLRLAKEVRRRLVKGEAVAQPYEQHLVRKDGTEATLRLTTSPIFGDGQLVAFQNIARDITEEKRMRENLRFYLQEIARAQEEERKRIARELHDSTAQTLIALLHQLENLMGDRAKLPVREAKALWGFYEQIRDVLGEVRRFSRDLRPSILDDLGLLPALEWVTGELQKEYGVEAAFKVLGSQRRFSPEAELILFRIVQEALRNIAKHAQASKAEVKVKFEKQKVRVTISDDGVGFQLPESLGELLHSGKLGLAGMQERVQLLGGNLKLKSKEGKGTTIVATAPI